METVLARAPRARVSRRSGSQRQGRSRPELPDTAVIAQEIADDYPNIAALLAGVSHDPDTTLGWCDDQFEFEFALDLLLDGLERLRDDAG